MSAGVFVLDREKAAEFRDALGKALVREEEYLHTAGQYREDGSYIVEQIGCPVVAVHWPSNATLI